MISFSLGEVIVTCEDSVKLFGVTIDYQLNFEHISNVCKKAFTPAKCLKENRWSFI